MSESRPLMANHEFASPKTRRSLRKRSRGLCTHPARSRYRCSPRFAIIYSPQAPTDIGFTSLVPQTGLSSTGFHLHNPPLFRISHIARFDIHRTEIIATCPKEDLSRSLPRSLHSSMPFPCTVSLPRSHLRCLIFFAPLLPLGWSPLLGTLKTLPQVGGYWESHRGRLPA